MAVKNIIVIILLAIFVTGCLQEKAPVAIDLPPTPSAGKFEQWGVILLPQLRLRSEPNTSSSIITTFWNPSRVILEIVSRSSGQVQVDNQYGFWYRVRFGGIEGWVFGAHIEIVNSREEARKRIRQLRS